MTCRIDNGIKFRKYNEASNPSNKPLVEGRVPSGWLMKNAHRISQDDFYNKRLSEEYLRTKYN